MIEILLLTFNIKSMKKVYLSVLLIVVLAISSCSSITHAMREPNIAVELKKADFTLSEQVSAEATSTTILGIDFERLFLSKSATLEKDNSLGISLAFIPVVGAYVTDKTQYYALYELMNNNQGYDFVIYPQFEKTVQLPIGLPIFKITTVKVTARLGKLN